MSEEEKKFLEIVDLKKGFGSGETRQEVLRGMNFSVAKGEFCVLLGPSGSGKSTLLNIIGGIDSADSGYISINGDKLEDMSEKKQVRTMQVMVVFFIVLSVVIAMDPPTFIAQLMGISWGALAGAFLAPFLYGLYWKGVTKVATVVCFVWGCAVAVLQLIVSLCGIDVTGWGTVLGYIFKSSINSGVVAMVGGLIIVPVISLITKKQSKEEIDNMFQCYETMVEVPVKESLED